MLKQFDCSPECMRIIEEIKKENHFRSFRETLEHIILHYDNESDNRIAEAVLKKLEEQYLPKEQIKLSIQSAEQNSLILLDAINTMLIKQQLNVGIPVDIAPSPVISESRKRIKEKLIHSKQNADRKKRHIH